MQSMSVRPEQVVSLAGQISTGANGIRERLEQLDSEVSKLRSSWDGSAQVAYDEAQVKWNKSLTELNQLLQKIASTTVDLSQGYVSQDRSSAGRFAV